MGQMIPFDSAKVPAHIKLKAIANKFAAAIGAGGFKIISIKGKVFHIVNGDERTLVTKPNDDEPASSLELVILDANPHKSKVFYTTGYSEGSDAKPTCYSNNGLSPEADSSEPQSSKCATCPQNVWGSKITEDGKKNRACSDSLRLAVAAAGQLNDPMLLRVPAATLKVLGSYGDLLAKRGVEPHQVVTKVGFDYTVAHPALTFKPVGFVNAEDMEEIEATRTTDVVAQILGTAPVVARAEDAFVPPPAPRIPAPAPKAEVPAPKPVAKPAAKPAPVAADDEDDYPAAPKTKVVVGSADDEAPPPKSAKAAPKSMAAEVAGALDTTGDLDFDD